MSKIVILGAGESGAGAAVLAKKEGFEVFVSDMSKIKDNYKKLMDDHGIEWEEGHHTEEKILDADEVIKSPGIPKEAPMIQKLMAKGTPIISEIEFAGRYTDAKSTCVRYEDTTQTTHIFFHSLIVDTARAFDGDNETNGYNQYMTTVDEFKAMLEELYKRNFVLVRIHDIAVEQTDANGATSYVQGDIYLPPEKKPLIISQDDVNYYEYMVDSDGDKLPDAGGDGFANRLVIGDDGKPTCQYITAEGETVYGDYDLVPILDKFVEEHPDFSYRGAKAIIAVTGYEGVYGYHTHPEWKEIIGIDEYDKECQAAREMTKCLKENGYEIASHSFGHPSYGEHSVDEVAEDVQKWEEQVQPIVGDTDIFIYPYGADIAGVEDYSGGKYEAMYAAGYRYFCNVDSTKYWVQIKQNYVRQGRRNLDGYRMWWNPELLEDLFDVQEIFDPARPTPVPSIG